MEDSIAACIVFRVKSLTLIPFHWQPFSVYICVKLCHIRYGKGQKVKLEKITVKVLHFVLVNQEGSH